MRTYTFTYAYVHAHMHMHTHGRAYMHTHTLSLCVPVSTLEAELALSWLLPGSQLWALVLPCPGHWPVGPPPPELQEGPVSPCVQTQSPEAAALPRSSGSVTHLRPRHQGCVSG